MIELAILFSLAIPAFLLMYAGFKFGEQHAWMKIFFISVGVIFSIGISFTGYVFAENGEATAYPDIAGYLIYFVLAIIVTMLLWVFYIIWLYIKSTSRISSGTDDEFMEDMEVD